jgi:hypothetical protein
VKDGRTVREDLGMASEVQEGQAMALSRLAYGTNRFLAPDDAVREEASQVRATERTVTAPAQVA